MDEERTSLSHIFYAAMDLPPEQQEQFLERACAGKPELRERVLALLSADARIGQTMVQNERARRDDLTTMPQRRPADKEEPAHGGGEALREGLQIGRYRLLQELQKGGMGTVFVAHDTDLDRRVAVKFLHMQSGGLAERFVAEARFTARCKHDNIVMIHDIGTFQKWPYIVLEYLEGETLGAWLDARKGQRQDPSVGALQTERASSVQPAPAVTPEQAVAMIIPVVRALVCAHEQHIVHRDLKPSNIFITTAGTIKVLDFGVAKLLPQDRGHDDVKVQGESPAVSAQRQPPAPTQHGVIIGTPLYMAPEQWNADSVDERTDLWAVGIILFEMVAGKHPLGPPALQSREQLLRIATLDSPMPEAAKAAPGLGELADIIDQCLMKRKEERMGSAAELLARLEAFLQHRRSQPGEPSRPPDRDARPPQDAPAAVEANPAPARVARRRPAVWLAPAAVAVMVAAGFALFWPRLAVPAFAEGSGGIVVAVDRYAGSEAADAFSHVCKQLRHRQAHGVACIELPYLGAGAAALRQAAAAAGAALVVRIRAGATLHTLAVDLAEWPLLAELPPVSAPTPEIREAFVPIAVALSRIAGRDIPMDAQEVAAVDMDMLGWRMAAVGWYLRTLTLADLDVDVLALQRLTQQCAREQSAADRYCALAHYVYGSSGRDMDGGRDALAAVRDQGPALLADMAAIALARADCKENPQRAALEVERLAGQYVDGDCRRVALMEVAACLLASQSQPATPVLREVAYPAPERIEHCPAGSRAAAYGKRGEWNMVARNWKQAETDFALAMGLRARAYYRLNWAEALLQQRAQRDDAAARIAETLALDLFSDSEHRLLAAFFRWAATRQSGDAAELYRHYAMFPESEVAMADSEGTLREMACGSDEAGAECRVYQVLTMPKLKDSEEALRAFLGAAR